MYTANVRVMLRKSVLDPQGVTVKGSLKSLDFNTVTDVRVGKYFQITLDAVSLEDARRLTEDMCKKLLTNPVIEEYSFEVTAGGASA